MADYTDNALLASIKALDNVVMPAVDPADPLAGEQLRLVSGFLKFLRIRLHHMHARQRFELHHNLALAQRIAADARLVSKEVSQRLDTAIEQADAVDRQRDAALVNIQAATSALCASISGIVRTVAQADPEIRRRVERQVLQGSKQWVDMQRAWFAPQGFELRPDELPGLDELFAVPSAPGRS
jgi:hypothetical protein